VHHPEPSATPVSLDPSPGTSASPRSTAASASPWPAGHRSGPDLSAYRGLGTWIDVYDQSDVFGPAAFGDPAGSVAELARNGVRTVFLEAGSYRHRPVAFPSTTARFIEAAHAAGLRVVAWYLPLFRSAPHDFAEVMRVIGFRTPGGQG